jgi:2-methylfumaryl-CoA hydratase
MPKDLTASDTYFEDFKEGEIIVHSAGRTVTDEHFAWTMRLGNTHPLHFDQGHKTALAGRPVVYGGLVFAWVAGLASRDTTENAYWLTGFTEGYHTQPTVSGDTLYALSKVLEKSGDQIRFQLIGIKNLHGGDAFEKYGAELFERENDKKKMGVEKIPEKVFEVEMTWRLRHRLTMESYV